jgi:hypothetical protein
MEARQLPAQIVERVKEALQALFHHPDRALLPWYRYALYIALQDDDPRTSQQVRAWLDLLAVRKALFCWQSIASSPRHSVRTQPPALISLAAETIRGDTDLRTVRAELDHALAYSDIAGEAPASPHYPAWCVYEAAARALGSAYAVADPAYAVPPSLDDAAGYAAIAVAGAFQKTPGAPGQDAEDARLRRAVFWEWWLREALPTAIAHAAWRR